MTSTEEGASALEAMRAAEAASLEAADSVRERLGAIQAEIEALRAEMERDRAQDEKDSAEDAQRARQGDLGPAAQTLQARIDREETTMAAVLSGADPHWSAVEMRRTFVTNVRQVIDELEDSDPEFAADYREVATLRAGQDIGEWSDVVDPAVGGPDRRDHPRGHDEDDRGGRW